MTWFLMIFFSAGHQFVFYNPSFNSLEECRQSANYPPHIAVYSQRLLKEYGRPMPVERVVCIDEENLKEFLELNKEFNEGKKGFTSL